MGDVYQKLRDSARGQHCTLQLPGVCIGGTDTTVLCHLRSNAGFKGSGMKVPDYWAVFGCRACHEVIDGANWRDGVMLFTGSDLREIMWCALQRTWAIWFHDGLLRVAGDNEKPAKPGKTSKIVPHPGVMRR